MKLRNYFLQRLLPFYVFYVGIEAVDFIYKIIIERASMDWGLHVLATMLLNLFVQTTVSFAYLAVLWLVYLLALPRRFHGGRFDHAFTVGSFFVFTYLVIFEELAEAIFWEEFEVTFNFIAVDYLVYTNEVIGNIVQSYPLGLILLAIMVLALVVVWLFRKRLTPPEGAPSFTKRFVAVVCGVCCCVFAYFAVDADYSEKISANRYNVEISKGGLYSLFSAFLNNELSYHDFYIVHDEAENLRILKAKLQQHNAVFTNDTSIERHIEANGEERRKNVIFVIMESMGMEFMNEVRTDGRDITPNLSRLANEGLFFSHLYATGTRTVRGIEAVTIAIPPLPGMSVVRRRDNGDLQNMGSIFKAKGYDVKWLYGGYGYFDNMNAYCEANGFSIVDRADVSKEKIHQATIWGIADEDLYTKCLEEADLAAASGKPFLQLVLNTSNHRPYTYPEGRIDIPSKTGRLGAVKYADYSIGDFIKRASQKPWYKDTLFVFIGDHGASSAGKKELNPEKHRVPLIFYGPEIVAPRRVDTVVSQIDALPTLLGILNFDYESPFYGMDALAPEYEPHYFISNYQYIGYGKGDYLLVMRPGQSFTLYDGDHRVKDLSDGATDPQMLNEAVAYYQHASDWRVRLRQQADRAQQE